MGKVDESILLKKSAYNFVSISRNTKADKSVNYRTKKGLLIYNPKQLFAKLKQKSWKFPRMKIQGERKGCSSEKEHKVNALALRAEEGRDYLR